MLRTGARHGSFPPIWRPLAHIAVSLKELKSGKWLVGDGKRGEGILAPRRKAREVDNDWVLAGSNFVIEVIGAHLSVWGRIIFFVFDFAVFAVFSGRFEGQASVRTDSGSAQDGLRTDLGWTQDGLRNPSIGCFVHHCKAADLGLRSWVSGRATDTIPRSIGVRSAA
jgi:hypothetical protein